MATRWPRTPEAAAEAADLAACRVRLRHGSRTFLAASWLLPAEVRESACALYAFCRQADDEVDGQADGHAPQGATSRADPRASAEALARLRERLAAVVAGRPGAHSADRALAQVVRRYAIPAALPEALLDGFAWDVQGRRYETLADVQDYAARVAGSVGAMMALLMGARSPEALARACDLGVAMQLSNIARDVGEDAAQQRLYLPAAWLREAGIDAEAWLARPQPSPALTGVVRRLLDEAEQLYARADAGIAMLPPGCRPGIRAARRLYAAIGHEVGRRGDAALQARARVPGARKLGLLLTALAGSDPAPSALATQPPLAATQFLVQAAAGSVAPQADARGRVEWVLQLFERLERQERLSRFDPHVAHRP